MNIKYMRLIAFLAFYSLQLPAQTIIGIINDKQITEEQKAQEIQKLIKNGTKVDQISDQILHPSALMLAANLGYAKIVKTLLDNNANVNLLDDIGASALFYAARKGYLEIVKLLLSKGANINLITKQGNNILLEILKGYGANQAEAKQNKDQFKKNIYDIIVLLVQNGANINAQGAAAELAKTPIMWAADWNNWDLIKFFISKKANLCLKDQNGKTLEAHLPDAKDKRLTKEESNFVEWVKNVVQQGKIDCDWVEVNR